MKVCRYDDDRLGLIADGSLYDITALQTSIREAASYSYRGDPVTAFVHTPDGRAQVMDAAAHSEPASLRSAALLAPVARPTKVIGAPTNYRDHIEEMAPKRAELGLGHTARIGEDGLFLKACSALVGPSEGVPVRFPNRRTDHEAEIVVVIGLAGSDIAQADALGHVAGYCLGLDMVVRGREDRSFRKSPDGYAVLGPWLTTADEVADPDDLAFELSVNGEIRQAANTKDLVYGIGRLIEFASSFYTLHPGDLIYTGTPAGVSPVHPGDTIRMVSQPTLGEMTVPVRAW